MASRKKGFGAAPGKKKPAAADDWVNQGASAAVASAASNVEESTSRITVDMPASMHKALKLHAVMEGTSMNALVRAWIAEKLELDG